MKCYIRNVLLINTSITNGNIDCNCLEAVVKNYPKHRGALVYVKEDGVDGKILIGNVERIYIINNCLFGDISFTKDWTFVVSLLVYKPFPLATIAGIFDMPEFSYLDNIEFIDNESDACSDAIDLSKSTPIGCLTAHTMTAHRKPCSQKQTRYSKRNMTM